MTGSVSEVETLDAFRLRGWAMLPDVFGPEDQASLKQEANRLIAFPGARPECQYYMDRFDNGQVRLARVEAISDALPCLKTSGLLTRLNSSAEELLGGPVVLFKDKLNIRYPHSAGYAPHQDAARWRQFGSQFVSFGIFLDPSGPHNGGFSFASYDLSQGLAATATGDFDAEHFVHLPRQDVVATAGDILAIDGRSPHCTTDNSSDATVLHLLLTFAQSENSGLRAAYYAAQVQAFDRVRIGNVFTFAARG